MDGKPKYPNVEAQLSGEDGNAFAVLCRVKRALRRAGVSEDEIADFRAEAMKGDYDNLLNVCAQWVEVS